MDDGLNPVRELLPGVRVRPLATLSEGERSTVRRVRATEPDGTEYALIVKQYWAADEGWLRESAALASVPDAVRVPRVIAAGAAPQLLVMEDLGDGSSVADALLGDDPRAAQDAVIGWAEAVADLHVATRGSRVQFRSALDARRGDVEVEESWMPSRIRDAERVLDRDCGSLGVNIPSGAIDELTGLVERLGGGSDAALTPADACPDNNVRIGGRSVLIDFEGAQWRHIAWDVAYLRVPWPTCWCAWQLPDHVVARAIEAYRRVAVAGFAAVEDDSFEHDLEAAVAGWSMITATWSLDHALGTDFDSDVQLDPARPTPTRRALILHRLGRAAESPELPALAELAADLRSTLQDRWGDVPLDLAPAFRVPPG